MIHRPYLLVINIALHRTGGRFWAEPLWHKDLLLHLNEITALTLFCPVIDTPAPADWLAVEHPRLKVIAGPLIGRLAWLKLPIIAHALAKAIDYTDIVHTGIAGWPFPLGWIAIPLARRKAKFVIVVVESSFWRATPGAGFTKRLKARIFEAINRSCLALSDLCFFTTPEYRDQLVGSERIGAHIALASWVDAEQILNNHDAAQAWASKQDSLLFVGRLTESKGVAVLLAAIERSAAKVDLIGEGPLEPAVRELAARLPDRVRLLAPVPYGTEFFALIDRYPALIVPTLTDEQPRIVIDAFARSVPVIASDAPGNRALAIEGETALVVPAGEVEALARALDDASNSHNDLRRMGLTALTNTRQMTHQSMHANRAMIITDALNDRI